MIGVSAVAGIGFTVSLFIADLAFEEPALADEAKVGIFAASLLAGALGFAVLRTGRAPPEVPSEADDAAIAAGHAG
jgi:NhaA family Na+:H+ antiporter